MNRAAWWTCALLALELAVSDARIYGRCELARDLRSLGVHPDHISTWVCIAYHESRYDTAANNPHSGDHGLFQISEIYWCGPGKACGMSCAALRDDDITDDLKCALHVHEEHTRLQGDGFLAWVVYPQHCKHNTKKYLIDCDKSVKNTVESQGRFFNSFIANDDQYRPELAEKTYVNNPNIDDLLPPYLVTISSIFRGSYGKVLDHNKINGIDWYNYKYDKIDELKLPGFAQVTNKEPVPTTTTTTTTTYIPPVKPWRFIETNEFRKKVSSTPKTTTNVIPSENGILSSSTSSPSTESTTHKSLTTVSIADILPKVKSTISSYKSSSTLTSTIKPVNITNTAYKSPAFTTSYKSWTTTYRPSTATYRSPTGSTGNYRNSNTGYKPSNAATTLKPTFTSFVFTLPTTPPKPTVISTTELAVTTNFSTNTVEPSTKVTRPTTSWFTFGSRPNNFGSSIATTFPQYSRLSTSALGYSQPTRFSFSTSTQKPTFSIATTQKSTNSFSSNQRPPSTTSTTQKTTYSTATNKWPWLSTSTTSRPTYLTTSTKWPVFSSYTTKWPLYSTSTSQKPLYSTSTTQKPKYSATYWPSFSTTTKQTYTNLPTQRSTSSIPSQRNLPQTTTTARATTQKTTRVTQNIFDLYLRPTKQPMLPSYSFSSRENSKSKINIFSGGTTTVLPYEKKNNNS